MTDGAEAGGPIGSIDPKDVGDAPRGGPGTASGGRPRASARLSDQAQARIGTSLRSLYDGIVQQPVPDRFRELIERLDAQEPKAP